MDAYRATVSASSEALLAELPQRVEQLHVLAKQQSGARDPTAVHAAFTQAITGNKIARNAQVQALALTTANEIERMLSALQLLAQWIQLMVPKVEDGNNFGVEVQKYAYVHLKESIATWQKAWDSLPDYAAQRAATVEKINDKLSQEKSQTTTVTEAKGGKDGDEDKSVKATVTKDSVTTSSPVDDWLAQLVVLDVKWYFNLAHLLEGLRDQYAITFDVIEKNKDKITRPRGSGAHGGFSMF